MFIKARENPQPPALNDNPDKQKGHFSWRIVVFAVMVLAFATYALYILPVSSSEFLGVVVFFPNKALSSLQLICLWVKHQASVLEGI